MIRSGLLLFYFAALFSLMDSAHSRAIDGGCLIEDFGTPCEIGGMSVEYPAPKDSKDEYNLPTVGDIDLQSILGGGNNSRNSGHKSEKNLVGVSPKNSSRKN